MAIPSEHPKLAELTVLVIEHDSVVREIVRYVLCDLGVRSISYACCPDEGLENFSALPYQLVIVGFHGQSEVQCRVLDALHNSLSCRSGETALIALAPHPDRETVIRARDAGAEALVAEPIAPKQLADHIALVVRHHKWRLAEGEAPAAPACDAVSPS